MNDNSHHGQGQHPLSDELEKELKAAGERLGASGRFPEGKLNENDEGELRLAVTSKDGKVIVDFGKPVNWLGLSRDQAMEFAKLLRKHARGW